MTLREKNLLRCELGIIYFTSVCKTSDITSITMTKKTFDNGVKTLIPF